MLLQAAVAAIVAAAAIAVIPVPRSRQRAADATSISPRTGFGFDLPEGMEITKGYFYPYDMGDVNYNSGVMMSWPVYADVPGDKYNELTDEEHRNVHTGSTFGIICVKDAADEDEAIEKCISVRKEIAGGEFSEAKEDVFRSLK